MAHIRSHERLLLVVLLDGAPTHAQGGINVNTTRASVSNVHLWSRPQPPSKRRRSQTRRGPRLATMVAPTSRQAKSDNCRVLEDHPRGVWLPVEATTRLAKYKAILGRSVNLDVDLASRLTAIVTTTDVRSYRGQRKLAMSLPHQAIGRQALLAPGPIGQTPVVQGVLTFQHLVGQPANQSLVDKPVHPGRLVSLWQLRLTISQLGVAPGENTDRWKLEDAGRRAMGIVRSATPGAPIGAHAKMRYGYRSS